MKRQLTACLLAFSMMFAMVPAFAMDTADTADGAPAPASDVTAVAEEPTTGAEPRGRRTSS